MLIEETNEVIFTSVSQPTNRPSIPRTMVSTYKQHSS